MVAFGKYVMISFLSTIGVIYHSFHTREQFYPAMLYLSTSKLSLVVIGNMAFVITFLFGQLIKWLFLGKLREAEVERLYELSRQEIMETCLAMTIFRDEFDASFLAMFTTLLFVKIFHWLSQKRIEYIETTPTVSRLSHVRIIAFTILLMAVDVAFLHYAVTQSVSDIMKNRRPSVLVLFAFEYFILASATVATFVKYGFYLTDEVLDGRWENKAVFVFYLELVRDLLHLFVYLVFFCIVFVYYGLPLHLVRDLYETFRSFRSRVADFIRYRRITSNLNERFSDATPEELSSGDATCIICREEMAAAKKLPCGHLFHIHCLRSWLERQQTCPTCRAPLLTPEHNRNNEAAANQGVAGAARGAAGAPQQVPGADGRFPGHAAAPGQLPGVHHVHVMGQYVPMGGPEALQAAYQAALYPQWRPNWYPTLNPYYAQLQQHFQHQQMLHYRQNNAGPYAPPGPPPPPAQSANPAQTAVPPSPPPPASAPSPSSASASSSSQSPPLAAPSPVSASVPRNGAESARHASQLAAAQLQMHAQLAAAWSAQAQLAMGGWPYGGLLNQQMYGYHPGAAGAQGGGAQQEGQVGGSQPLPAQTPTPSPASASGAQNVEVMGGSNSAATSNSGEINDGIQEHSESGEAAKIAQTEEGSSSGSVIDAESSDDKETLRRRRVQRFGSESQSDP